MRISLVSRSRAVRQRILDGKLAGSDIRVKGVAREYRISAQSVRDHYDPSDADMTRLAKEAVRYRVGFMGWGLELLPFPNYQAEHAAHDEAVAEAKRVLAILPRFRKENAEMERWLPVRFPTEPYKAVIYPDPFDCARFGMEPEHPTVEIISADS